MFRACRRDVETLPPGPADYALPISMLALPPSSAVRRWADQWTTGKFQTTGAYSADPERRYSIKNSNRYPPNRYPGFQVASMRGWLTWLLFHLTVARTGAPSLAAAQNRTLQSVNLFLRQAMPVFFTRPTSSEVTTSRNAAMKSPILSTRCVSRQFWDSTRFAPYLLL